MVWYTLNSVRATSYLAVILKVWRNFRLFHLFLIALLFYSLYCLSGRHRSLSWNDAFPILCLLPYNMTDDARAYAMDSKRILFFFLPVSEQHYRLELGRSWVEYFKELYGTTGIIRKMDCFQHQAAFFEVNLSLVWCHEKWQTTKIGSSAHWSVSSAEGTNCNYNQYAVFNATFGAVTLYSVAKGHNWFRDFHFEAIIC